MSPGLSDPTGAFGPLREALGDLVIASSGVEESLQDGILMLGGALEDEDKYKVGTSTLGWLISEFETQYRIQSDQVGGAEPVKVLCQDLRKLSRDRNDLIHGMWTFDSEVGVAERHRVRKAVGGLELNTEAVQPDNVLELASRFRSAGDKLWEVLVQLGDRKRLGS